MKKFISILLAMMLFVPLLVFTALPAYAANGEEIKIVVSADANQYEKAAAEFLRDTVKASTGTEYSIITDDIAKSNFEISIGETNRFSTDISGYDNGAYIIKSYAGGVAVVGAGTRGNIYGVCRLLKDYGNYRCFVAGDSFTNDGSTLSIPDDINIEYKPFFEYTETDWRLNFSDSEIYPVVNGLNGGIYNNISDNYGGTVNYIGGFAHTLTNLFCSKDKYFASHPEYFALRDGERTPNQLCLTSEDTYQVVLNEVMELLKIYASDGAFHILSLTQHDNEDYCECENCKKLDEENGSHAGTMITFTNRIAEQVELAGYNNVAVDTFAYQYTRTPPTNVVPRDNVIVRLCSIECCFSHPFDDPTCEENVNFMKDLESWSKICNRIYIWDYATNYARTLGIFPDFGVLQRNMQILYENNVKGVYVEGNYYLEDSDTEFGDLRSYLISCLLTDPYCDYDKAISEFCNAYYGAGGEQIAEFVRMTIDGAKDNHLGISNYIGTSLSFTKDEVKKCDKLWETAKQNTADDETANARIKRSEISWRLWKSSTRNSEFSGLGLYPERMRLYRDICNLGIYKYSEASGKIILPLNTILGRPDFWNHAKGASTWDYSGFADFCINLYDSIRNLFGNLFGKLIGC